LNKDLFVDRIHYLLTMEEDLPAAVDIVMKYGTYEEFLDSQVTRLDLSYLEV
jgi:hypothetical protein